MADDKLYVLDSCAVLAFLQREPGAEVVADILTDSRNRCLCFALALTLLENGTLLTSDHHELDQFAQAKVCPIRFIR